VDRDDCGAGDRGQQPGQLSRSRAAV